MGPCSSGGSKNWQKTIIMNCKDGAGDCDPSLYVCTCSSLTFISNISDASFVFAGDESRLVYESIHKTIYNPTPPAALFQRARPRGCTSAPSVRWRAAAVS